MAHGRGARVGKAHPAGLREPCGAGILRARAREVMPPAAASALVCAPMASKMTLGLYYTLSHVVEATGATRYP